MDFTIRDEQRELGELTDQVLARHERVDRRGFDRDLWSHLATTGILGVGLPEDLGGIGLGVFERCEVLRRYGRVLPALPVLPVIGVAAPAVPMICDESLRQSMAKALTAGETFPTEAFAEVGGGLGAEQPRAVEDGGRWRISGVRTAVPYARVATWALLPAQTASGRRAFFVDLTAGDISVSDQELTGHSPAGHLELDGAVGVPVVDRTGDAEATLRGIEQHGALSTCAVALGISERALELTAAYVMERKVFGRPVASFQAVGQRAADAYIDAWSQELSLHHAATLLADEEDAERAVALAKVHASRGGAAVIASCVHLHGGVGVDRSNEFHRFFLGGTELVARFGGPSETLARLGALIAETNDDLV